MFLQMAQDAHNWTLVAELSTMIHHNKGRFNDFNISNASAGQWAGTPNNTVPAGQWRYIECQNHWISPNHTWAEVTITAVAAGNKSDSGWFVITSGYVPENRKNAPGKISQFTSGTNINSKSPIVITVVAILLVLNTLVFLPWLRTHCGYILKDLWFPIMFS